MYSFKSKCAIRYGEKRTNFFEYSRGVRQGCILSPILFNLYLNGLPKVLTSNSPQETDPIILPNSYLINCLFYADDLVLISRSVSGLQKQINILQKYCEEWLLTTNLKQPQNFNIPKTKP